MFEKFKKPQEFNKPIREKKDNCKIKIKNSNGSREIQFSGNCSREEIQIARENLGLDDKKEEN